MKTRITFLLAFILLALLTPFSTANHLAAKQESSEGVYFVQSLDQLKLTGEEKSPFTSNENNWNMEFWDNARWGYATLDQAGDVYLELGEGLGNRFRARTDDVPNYKIAIRLESAADVSGTLYFPTTWNGPLVAFRFEVKADQFTAERKDFLAAKLSHYRYLWNARNSGSAWFRYQANQIAAELGTNESVSDEGQQRNVDWQTESEMERSLSLVSGGMALSENLQLDRMLTIGTGDDKETFPVDEIEGITVNEFDWDPLVKGIDPKLDTLASYIPADQHAMFLPSFQSLVTLIETGFETAGPLVPLMSGTSESANTRQRYQDQLGLPLGEIQKVFGPRLIKSIAITGGDPYFRTGTDVAILFESSEPATLTSAIHATIAMSVANKSDAEKVSGTAGSVEYQGYRSPDRRVSTYIATLDNVVLVSNSLVQLNRIVEVSNQPRTALASLDEFRFFRDRYVLGDEQETALIVITDQTIRRWCSPQWRIATSRRTRAAAVLSDLHARYMSQLAAGMETPVNVDIGASVFALNQFTVVGNAAISPTYGTLEFQTPVNELELNKVSGREKTAYENWRRGYQSNWSTAFDPIAIRLNLSDGKLAADLTVLPLIDNSEYQSLSDVSIGAALDAKRNSSHPEAMAWLALALNTESPSLKQFGNMGSAFTQVNFMDWLGDAAVVFVDEDPLWDEFEKVAGNDNDQEKFIQSNLHRLPVAIQFNVRSSIRLTAFLVGIRGFVEQSAPDMTIWETLRHRETAYVKISPSANTRRDIPDDIDANIALYYFASGDTLIFSLSEPLIQRAIDRRLAEQPAEGESAESESVAETGSLPLLGENFAVHVKRSLALGLISFANESYQQQMQRQAWAVIPILNEWKRLFPDRDPREIDQLVWKRVLDCPGGGQYRWNEVFKTMESSFYGHPAEPKYGPHVAQLLGTWETGNFGLTFENDGLRARFELIGTGANELIEDR